MANQRMDIYDITVRVCVSKNTLTKFGTRKRGLYVKRHALVIITYMLLFNIVAIQNACQTKTKNKKNKTKQSKTK